MAKKTLPGMKGVEIPDKGFFYHDPTHRYFLNGERMTGVTSIVDNVGDKSNLIQWAENQGAANGIMRAADLDVSAFTEAVQQYRRLGSREVAELDKLFPPFKEARTSSSRIKNSAGDAGTEAHRLCELFELDVREGEEWDEASEEALRRFGIYRKWYEENVERTYFVERPLFSIEHFIGGTPDGGFRMKNGRNLINDKKFKPYIYDPSPFRQMAAYRMMLEEMASDTTTPVRIDWGGGRAEWFTSPSAYLGSFGEVKWDGAIVIRVGEDDFEEMYANTYETDKRGFLAALEIYRENGAFKNRLTTAV